MSSPFFFEVILDRALTVLSNFKLASGCELEVLGGPLGALVGGYSDAEWLYDEARKTRHDARPKSLDFTKIRCCFPQKCSRYIHRIPWVFAYVFYFSRTVSCCSISGMKF